MISTVNQNADVFGGVEIYNGYGKKEVEYFKGEDDFGILGVIRYIVEVFVGFYLFVEVVDRDIFSLYQDLDDEVDFKDFFGGSEVVDLDGVLDG